MAEKKLLYKRQILKQLYFSKTLSCADLSTRINKSIVLTTRMLNELIKEGTVSETGFAPSSGGRRPIMYSLKPDVMYVVAVSMDQLITRISIMDMKLENVTPVERVELRLTNNPDALPQLIEKIEAFIKRAGIVKEKIAGIGIGMPGFIDVTKGLNYSFFNTGSQSICDIIVDKVGLPVFIDNDSRLIALAELKFGAARKQKNVMVVNVNWGVGLGLILNGEIFRGYNGFAGEFSHIPLFTNNKLCSCGKHGCLETEASLLVVAEKALEGLKSGEVSTLQKFSLEHTEEACAAIMEAANKGDRFSVGLLSEAGYHIGRGLAILIHILNPELIILSGRGSLAGKIWKTPIQQALNEHCIPRLASNTVIEVSELGYDAELIGSAALVMENFGQVLDKLADGNGPTSHIL
jgi:predicted NBD/HSP70 family sugar kinase